MQLYKYQGFFFFKKKQILFICHKNMIIDVCVCDWDFKDVLDKDLLVFIKKNTFVTQQFAVISNLQ